MKRLLTILSLCIVMTTSQAGISKLKDLEGFRSTAYADGAPNGHQMFSIGYGHQIKAGETSLKTGKISVDTGVALMRSDIAPIEKTINSDLRVKPTQNQFDALVLFGYNTPDGLNHVIATWNSTKDANKATANMLLYNKWHPSPGVLAVNPDLAKRRAAEISLFNSTLAPAVKNSLLVAGAGLCVAFLVLRT
ncbi:lysozyme [Mucilaginibacter sp. 10B2]|uniref:lysozyme n=1 Tax=Mucilaginibacter sp. 10B2 TaxID=3048574 RepID=UPI002B227E51|nr:lysozyme [Mucilaginibacter sp. 10B2]MEB0278970.1 lysozyme [Mucilaginibacter sp. 10B2]